MATTQQNKPTEEQRQFAARVEESITRCKALAEKARAANLPVLADFIAEAALVLKIGLQKQLQAIRKAGE